MPHPLIRFTCPLLTMPTSPPPPPPPPHLHSHGDVGKWHVVSLHPHLGPGIATQGRVGGKVLNCCSATQHSSSWLTPGGRERGVICYIHPHKIGNGHHAKKTQLYFDGQVGGVLDVLNPSGTQQGSPHPPHCTFTWVMSTTQCTDGASNILHAHNPPHSHVLRSLLKDLA